MTISNEAVEAAAEAIMHAAFGQELPEAPDDLARASLEAAAPIIRAEALREAGDAAFKDKKLQGLQRALIGNYLRARALAERGRK